MNGSSRISSRGRHHGGDELHLLAHTLAQGIDPLAGAVRKIEALQPALDFRPRVTPAAQPGVEQQQGQDLHAAIEAALFALAVQPVTEDANGAAVRMK